MAVALSASECAPRGRVRVPGRTEGPACTTWSARPVQGGTEPWHTRRARAGACARWRSPRAPSKVAPSLGPVWLARAGARIRGRGPRAPSKVAPSLGAPGVRAPAPVSEGVVRAPRPRWHRALAHPVCVRRRPCPRAWSARPVQGGTEPWRTRRAHAGARARAGHNVTLRLGAERLSPEQYWREVMQHKFCLVSRGDTPSTRKVGEAFVVAARGGCLPVFVQGVQQYAFAGGPEGASRVGWVVKNDAGFLASLSRIGRAVDAREWAVRRDRAKSIAPLFEQPTAARAIWQRLLAGLAKATPVGVAKASPGAALWTRSSSPM